MKTAVQHPRIFNENYFCKMRLFDSKLPAQLNNSRYAFNPPSRHDVDKQALPSNTHATPDVRPPHRFNAALRALTTLAFNAAPPPHDPRVTGSIATR